MTDDMYRVGDTVIVKSTHCGALDGGPDIGTGEITEIFFNRGVRTLVVRVGGHPGRFIRLEEQVKPAQ